jgi:hypothetical protein
MANVFESPWLKWAQAVINAEALEDNINELARQGVLQMRFGMTKEYDPKRHCIVITTGPDEVPAVFPVQMGLLLGDIVHNYRSSLDHLAWALYKRGRTPNLSKTKEKSVAFPIANERTGFNGSLESKLPGVRRTDAAIVRRYQPYKTAKRYRDRHLFRVLAKLSNDDKHRVIQPIQAVPERAEFRIIEVTGCVITRLQPRTRRVALEPGTELVRFYVRKAHRRSEPDIDVEPRFTIDPSVDERFTFEEWGYRTMRYTAQLLNEFAEPPQSVLTLLGATRHGESPGWLPLSKG